MSTWDGEPSGYAAALLAWCENEIAAVGEAQADRTAAWIEAQLRAGVQVELGRDALGAITIRVAGQVLPHGRREIVQ